MNRDENKMLQAILDKLNYLDPPIRNFPVLPPDPAMAVFFLDLKTVCYITTKSEAGREEVMFMTDTGEPFYTNLRLSQVEEQLKGHPHFIRTSKFHLVNLTKIRGLRVSAARDLWFHGQKDPVLNAVTNTYLGDFEKHMK